MSCRRRSKITSDERNFIGSWKTREIESEWGPNTISLHIRPDGFLTQANEFRNGKAYERTGRYEIEGDRLSVDFEDASNPAREFVAAFHMIDANRLQLKLANETYVFRRQ